MYNWRKACTVLTVVVLLAVILLSQFGSPLTRLQMKRQVAQYLQEQGYTVEQLAEVQTVYDKREQNEYLVKVVFADAPDKAHYYFYDEDKQIQELEKLEP